MNNCKYKFDWVFNGNSKNVESAAYKGGGLGLKNRRIYSLMSKSLRSKFPWRDPIIYIRVQIT